MCAQPISFCRTPDKFKHSLSPISVPARKPNLLVELLVYYLRLGAPQDENCGAFFAPWTVIVSAVRDQSTELSATYHLAANICLTSVQGGC